MFEGHFLGNDERFYLALGCTHPPLPSPPPTGTNFGPTASTLISGEHLSPGPILEGTAYQAVADFGIDAKDPAKYYPFAYDWRLDLRYNAQLLLNVLKDGGRWNILCHSQGGLLVAVASLLAGADAWAKMVRNVSFVAVPFVGTGRALEAVLDGTNFGKPTQAVFRRTARTWPAIYQLFPQYFCITNNPSALILQPALWSGLGADGQSLVTRARDLWQWVDHQPFRAMNPNTLAFFFGRSAAPNTPVYVTADGVVLPTLTNDLDLGDTLVPWTPTIDFLKWSGLERRVLPIVGPLQKDHAYLLNDASVFRAAHQFLAAP
jgi:hypothetical protein